MGSISNDHYVSTNNGTEMVTKNKNELKTKRFAPFLEKFIFKTVVNLIWNLFGFFQKMRLEEKVNRLKISVGQNTENIANNQEAIRNLSTIVSGNSIAIDQLRITTTDLDKRVVILEKRVSTLETSLDALLDGH